MKKIIICLLSILLIANVAHANCNEGTVIKGKNDVTYCKSDVIVNWFTAFSWCESQGMTLVSLEEACPGFQLNSKCANLAGTSDGFAWTAPPSGPYNAVLLGLYDGRLVSNSRISGYPALCK